MVGQVLGNNDKQNPEDCVPAGQQGSRAKDLDNFTHKFVYPDGKQYYQVRRIYDLCSCFTKAPAMTSITSGHHSCKFFC
jgi:hypothetical protein